jgi:hypothetical protein
MFYSLTANGYMYTVQCNNMVNSRNGPCHPHSKFKKTVIFKGSDVQYLHDTPTAANLKHLPDKTTHNA